MATRPQTGGDIVKLKVTLRHIKPPIWRRLMIPASLSLYDLHRLLQVCLGWGNQHLHGFDFRRDKFGAPDILDDPDNEGSVTLSLLLRRGIKRFRYTYDFGDSWEHDIEIDGGQPRVPGQQYPICLAGKRAAPPEDCGGFPGYYDIIESLADPKHPDRSERLDWLGDYDPEAFSLPGINAELAVRFGIKSRR
jgi:hypothetical protein